MLYRQLYAYIPTSSFTDRAVTKRSCGNRLQICGLEERSWKLMQKFGGDIFWNSVTRKKQRRMKGYTSAVYAVLIWTRHKQIGTVSHSRICFIGT
jgi:hypothetical protein